MPIVADVKLQNLVDNVYKGVDNPNRIGAGTLGDAIRHELKTGQQVQNKWHIQKGEDTIRGLEKWIANTPHALEVEKQVAWDIITDLKDALGKKQ